MKVIQWMCVTLNSKVNRQGHGIVFNIFDILDLGNVRIDTKINFVSWLQPEIWKVMQKGVWPWFSRSCNEDRIFSLSPLDSLTPKTYPWEIFLKNSDGKTKIQGGGTHPPLGVRRWIFTLGICGLRCYMVLFLGIIHFGTIFILVLSIAGYSLWKLNRRVSKKLLRIYPPRQTISERFNPWRDIELYLARSGHMIRWTTGCSNKNSCAAKITSVLGILVLLRS